MRTSPSGMRRRLRRAPLLLPALTLVVALGAACSDDGADDDTAPTTTAPSTTSTGADEADTGGGTAATDPPDGGDDAPTTSGPAAETAGDDAEVLTADDAEAQLDALLQVYARALAEVRATGALDEVALQAFTGAFTLTAAQGELTGLQQVGAPAALNPTPQPLAASEVALVEAEATCASGSFRYDGFETILTTPPAATQPFWFRLVPADEGARSPGWRIDFLRFGADAEGSSRCP